MENKGSGYNQEVGSVSLVVVGKLGDRGLQPTIQMRPGVFSGCYSVQFYIRKGMGGEMVPGNGFGTFLRLH